MKSLRGTRRPAAPCLLAAASALAAAAAAAGCASGPRRDVRWEPVVVWSGDSAFERLKAGRPDPTDPDMQVVGVDQAGNMVLVHFHAGVAPSADVIYRNHSEITGLSIADVDPSIPGEEIYAGCYEPGKDDEGGNVIQVWHTPEGWQVRRIFEAGHYVHSVEVVPASATAPVRLVASTYANEVHVLTPPATDGGAWGDVLVYRGQQTFPDPQPKESRPRFKDVALVGDPSGAPAHEILAVLAGGDVVYADLDRPGSGRVVHQEEGGYGRICSDGATGAYTCGYWGRVQHFVRDGASPGGSGWTFDVIDQEGKDSGLRGVVMGSFPLPGPCGGTAPLAIFGFHKRVRALVPNGAVYDPVTLFVDIDRGHTEIAADLVPGNDADELVVSGYSKRITILVAR